MMSNPYFQNVASEFIALVILAFAAIGIYRLTGRKRLLAFFHITSPKRFLVYLSRITVAPGGSLGVDNQPRSFCGPTLALTEMGLVGPIQRLFNYIIPGVEGLPGILKSILVSDVATEFLPSPIRPAEVDTQTPFLSLGSPGYNAASQRIQDDYSPLARFEPDNLRVTVHNLGTMQDSLIGFLVRARHPTSGHIAYYAAGPASVGTAGAAIFLIKNWSALRNKYGDMNPFVVLLRFQSSDPRQYEVVVEKGT